MENFLSWIREKIILGIIYVGGGGFAIYLYYTWFCSLGAKNGAIGILVIAAYVFAVFFLISILGVYCL